MMLARLGPPERGHRADAHDAGPFWAHLMLMMLGLGPNGQGHRADAHDAGPFGAHRKGAIELMHMMLGPARVGPPEGAIELMLMMLARLGPTGKGPSS